MNYLNAITYPRRKSDDFDAPAEAHYLDEEELEEPKALPMPKSFSDFKFMIPRKAGVAVVEKKPKQARTASISHSPSINRSPSVSSSTIKSEPTDDNTLKEVSPFALKPVEAQRSGSGLPHFVTSGKGQKRQVLNTRAPGRNSSVVKNSNDPDSDLAIVNYLLDDIKSCIRAARDGDNLQRAISELRETLHDLEIHHFDSIHQVQMSPAMGNNGLPRIFNDEEIFPWDMKVDARLLHTRWQQAHYDPHLLRGILVTRAVLDKETETKKTTTSYAMDEAYRHKHPADRPGDNGLTNGQWWPLRSCTLRDGAHGAMEAGISGKKDEGAFAVVISGHSYDDEDLGDTVEYCGSKSKTSEPTRDTNLMLHSLAFNQHVRVLRKGPSKSVFAPAAGYRYDGLYKVIDGAKTEDNLGNYKFILQRVPGQDPIRYHGVEARPTRQELKAWEMIQHRVKLQTPQGRVGE